MDAGPLLGGGAYLGRTIGNQEERGYQAATDRHRSSVIDKTNWIFWENRCPLTRLLSVHAYRLLFDLWFSTMRTFTSRGLKTCTL